MSPPGRPKGEYRSAQHEGSPVSAPGRPERECRSAQREGSPVNAKPALKPGFPASIYSSNPLTEASLSHPEAGKG